MTFFQIVIVFLIFCLVLLILMPALCGWYVRMQFENSLQEFNSSPQFSLVVIDSAPGWFSTNYSIKVLQANTVHFQSNVQLIHGPIYLGAAQRRDAFFIWGYINADINVLVSDTKMGQPTSVKVKGAFDMSGNANGQIKSLGNFGKRLNENFILEAIPSNSQFKFNIHKNLLNIYLHIPLLTVSTPLYKTKLHNVKIAVDVKFSQQYGVTGKVDIEVGEGAVLEMANANQVFELKNLMLHINAAKNNTFINYQLRTGLAEVTIDNNDYSNAEIDLIVRNINADAVSQINKQIHETIQHKYQLPESDALWQEVLGLVPGLIKDIELELSRLYLVSSYGYVNAWFRFSMPGMSQGPIMDPILLLSAIQFDGEASVSEPIVRSLYESQTLNIFLQNKQDKQGLQPPTNDEAILLLESLRNQRYVDLEDGQYISSIKIVDGDVTINDQPFNPILWVMPEQNKASAN